jgi:hypothetical protein
VKQRGIYNIIYQVAQLVHPPQVKQVEELGGMVAKKKKKKAEKGTRMSISWVFLRNSSSVGLLKSWARVTELARCQLRPRLPAPTLVEMNKRSSLAFQGSFLYQMFSLDPLGCCGDRWQEER